RRLKLSGLIQQRLAATAAKHQQRTRLLHAVIVAQAIFTAATAAGYAGERSATLHLAIAAVSVAVYLAALAASALFRRMNAAAYLLVGGGLVVVAAQTVSLAVEPNPEMVAQASLLFIALIFEAALLFTPTVTLLAAFITVVCTAFAILFSLSLEPSMDQATAYLLMVYPVGLQALAGIVAWVVAQTAVEVATDAARDEETHFAEARLAAMATQQAELTDHVQSLQDAITRALGGDALTHADIGDGVLAPLAESINVLMQRLAELNQADLDLMRMGAAAFPMMDALTRLGDMPTPTPSSLPIMTNTPLDSVQLRLAQAQANVTARMQRMQRLAAEVQGVLGNSQQSLDNAAESVQESLRIAGLLYSAANDMLTLSTRQMTALQRVRHVLAAHLPAEVTGPTRDPREVPAGTEALSREDLAGLRDVIGPSGFTGTFDVVDSGAGPDADADASDETMTNITPLTRPMRAIDPHALDEAPSAKTPKKARGASTGAAGDLSKLATTDLLDLWSALVELAGEMTELDRAAAKLVRDVSAQSKTLRSADGDVAYLRQSLAAIRASADGLQQMAGAGLPIPPAPDATPGSTPRAMGQTPYPPAMSLPQGPSVPPPETLAELGTATPMPLDPAGETPSPGSLRAADLLQFSGDLSTLAQQHEEAAGNGNHGTEERE
ncbi:MAG TPA: hypothetical protein VJQ45_11135, partial [Ktedonobacterales bacterium]|nr:hypothetical protein [Ktedonobacterales bacterium]